MKADRNTLDETPPTGLGPTQVVREANTLVASARIPHHNQRRTKKLR